jgi:hypothetical protein
VRPLAIALAIVLTIVAMAGVLVYFGALFSGPSAASGPSCVCGPTFAVGTPIAGMNGSTWTYQMGITPGDGMTEGSLSFQVQADSGTNLSLPQATVQVLGVTNCHVGEYDFSTKAWSSGPVTASNACSPPGTAQTILTSGMALVLSTGSSDLRGQGDRLVVLVGTSNTSVELP